MEKVKVNKELFDLLDLLETRNIEIICKLKAKDYIFINKFLEILNELTFKEMMDIHYKGYELKETPEEELLRIFNMKNITERDIGFNKGILKTLNLLGIKIEGINS